MAASTTAPAATFAPFVMLSRRMIYTPTTPHQTEQLFFQLRRVEQHDRSPVREPSALPSPPWRGASH
jgi:hypothetical protein